MDQRELNANMAARAYFMGGLTSFVGGCVLVSGDADGVWILAFGICILILGRAGARLNR